MYKFFLMCGLFPGDLLSQKIIPHVIETGRKSQCSNTRCIQLLICLNQSPDIRLRLRITCVKLEQNQQFSRYHLQLARIFCEFCQRFTHKFMHALRATSRVLAIRSLLINGFQIFREFKTAVMQI